MNLVIKLISGKEITLEIDPNTKISKIAQLAYKNRPESQKGVKSYNYYYNIDLFFGDQNLDYDKTLADYKIHEAATLVEVGKKHTKSAGFNWDTLTTRKEVESFKREINTIIKLYEISDEKFGIINQDKDRGKTIEKMVASLNSIVQNKDYLLDEDYEQIITVLQTALNETNNSHKNKSIFGFFGVTESRLANRLSSYIDKLRSDQKECHSELGLLTTKPLPAPRYSRM